jgi:hypothetical protein
MMSSWFLIGFRSQPPQSHCYLHRQLVIFSRIHQQPSPASAAAMHVRPYASNADSESDNNHHDNNTSKPPTTIRSRPRPVAARSFDKFTQDAAPTNKSKPQPHPQPQPQVQLQSQSQPVPLEYFTSPSLNSIAALPSAASLSISPPTMLHSSNAAFAITSSQPKPIRTAKSTQPSKDNYQAQAQAQTQVQHVRAINDNNGSSSQNFSSMFSNPQ